MNEFKIFIKLKKVLRIIKAFFVRMSRYSKRRNLKNRTFSIVSNNCAGGYIYQYYGIQYKSPTAGLLFGSGEDYLRICKNPHKYFEKDPVIIPIESCKHYNLMKKMNRWGEYPVGIVEDVEIYFMHYSNSEEAISKWKKRSKRVNYNNMFFLLTENETFTEKDIKEFCGLPIKNKICLTYNKYDIPGTVYSEQVHNLEGHPWKPEIVCSILDWTTLLNACLYN